MGGMVVQVREKVSKGSGRGWARVLLEDLTGSVEVVVWPKTYERCRDLLHTDAVLVVRGRVETQEGAVLLLADEVRPLEPDRVEGNGGARPQERPLHIRVTTAEEMLQLVEFLASRNGPRPAYAHVLTMQGESIHRLRQGVPDDEEFLRELKHFLGEGAVWEES